MATIPYGALTCLGDNCDETLDWHDVDANVKEWGVFRQVCVDCIEWETINQCWLYADTSSN